VSRPGTRPSLPSLLVALPLLLVGLLGLPGPLAAPASAEPTPLLWSGSAADPSVVKVGKRRVVVATGRQVVRAFKDPGTTWQWTDPVLSHRPEWARPDADIWAADISRAGGRWVLYYSVPVHGLGSEWGRCVGVAVSDRILGSFRPVGTRPLVCPKRANTPRAADRVKGAEGLPVIGIIDPSVFVERGKRYLLYKTDGYPSSIRILPLTKGGLGVRKGADPKRPSWELVRSPGVIENPVLLRRKSDYYLFASEGDFARCSYRQTWRRGTSLRSWQTEESGVLLNRKLTGGVCGPAGGDILVEGKKTTLYFHGWVRRGTTVPVGAKFWLMDGKVKALRAMYGARLAFPGKVPTIRRFLG